MFEKQMGSSKKWLPWTGGAGGPGLPPPALDADPGSQGRGGRSLAGEGKAPTRGTKAADLCLQELSPLQSEGQARRGQAADAP